ncbi:MAG: AIR synthase-related protein, partial [Chthoniobacterales bacterium]
EEGDVILLVGAAAINDSGYNLGGSRYLKVCHGLKIGPPPHVDLAHEINVQNAVRDLIRGGVVQSAHDCSEGGLAVTLAESCFNPERLFGADVDCSRRPAGDAHASRRDAATVLFNESQSRILISVAPENVANAIAILRERDIPFQQLGKVRGNELHIRIHEQAFRWQVAEIYDEWWNAICRAVEQDERIPSL